MKCAVFGGVVSTRVLIERLAHHGFSNVHVWGYEPAEGTVVSGLADLKRASMEAAFGYDGFRRIVDCEEGLRAFSPDVVFVVGLSQLIPKPMLSIAKIANVGFHPAPLPKGRGRAPVAWLLLEQLNGAATFFSLRDGADDGPVFVQVPFEVSGDDNAGTVYEKALEAEVAALDHWLPRLKKGDLQAAEQDHGVATWFGRRAPEDGLLDWAAPRDEILRLIRASAPPHPGAYSYSGDVRINILAAVPEDRTEKGVIGRILSKHKYDSFVVQAGDSLIRVTCWHADSDWKPKVGIKLGYDMETEVFDLRAQVRALKVTLDDLRHRMELLGRKG